MRFKKQLITLATVAGILAFAIGIYWLMTRTPAELREEVITEKKWVVETTLVQQGDFQPQQQLVGSVRSAASVRLNAVISAEIKAIHFQSGALVRSGDVIIELDQQDLKDQFTLADADLEYSLAAIEIAENNHGLNQKTLELEQKQLNQATKELGNLSALLNENLASETQVDQKAFEVETRQLSVFQRQLLINNFAPQLQQLESQRDKATLNRLRIKRQLNDSNVKAPFDGSLSLNIEQVGALVNPGQQLASIFSHSQLELTSQLPTKFVDALNQSQNLTNQPESLTGWVSINNSQIPVTLASVSSDIESGFASRRGIFTIDSDQSNLIPGQSVSFSVNAPIVRNSFLLPELSVFGSNRVYRKNSDSRLEAIQIELHGMTQQGADNKSNFFIATSEQLNANDELIVTRLANVINNLLVISPEQAETERLEKLAKEEAEQAEDNSDD